MAQTVTPRTYRLDEVMPTALHLMWAAFADLDFIRTEDGTVLVRAPSATTELPTKEGE